MNPDAPARATVLVVEDEDSIRTIIQLALETKGYRLLTASDSAEGLRIAQSYDGPIDLVISDMLLPGVNGSELIRRLLVIRPEVHVIYISGYLGNETDLPAGQIGKTRFLPKPFTPSQLLEAVRAVFA